MANSRSGRRHTRKSAGLLLYRVRSGDLEVLLAHPGGPFWSRKEQGSWSIPKGEVGDHEDPLHAAVREFVEEMGSEPVLTHDPIALTPVRQAGGKTVHAWALRSDFDPDRLVSNTFTIEWPPRSGRRQTFAEIDRVSWFALAEARHKIIQGQVGLVDELEQRFVSGNLP
jgi:predicted NUDIX family NTP pyrophosphohydrolase